MDYQTTQKTLKKIEILIKREQSKQACLNAPDLKALNEGISQWVQVVGDLEDEEIGGT